MATGPLLLVCHLPCVRGRHEATETSKCTSRTEWVHFISGPNSPTKSHFPSSSLHNCLSKSSTIYLFPDRVVAEKAADFTPGERPRGVGISIPGQHFNIQGLQLAGVECSAWQRTWLKINSWDIPTTEARKREFWMFLRTSGCSYPIIPQGRIQWCLIPGISLTIANKVLSITIFLTVWKGIFLRKDKWLIALNTGGDDRKNCEHVRVLSLDLIFFFNLRTKRDNLVSRKRSDSLHIKYSQQD